MNEVVNEKTKCVRLEAVFTCKGKVAFVSRSDQQYTYCPDCIEYNLFASVDNVNGFLDLFCFITNLIVTDKE